MSNECNTLLFLFFPVLHLTTSTPAKSVALIASLSIRVCLLLWRFSAELMITCEKTRAVCFTTMCSLSAGSDGVGQRRETEKLECSQMVSEMTEKKTSSHHVGCGPSVSFSIFFSSVYFKILYICIFTFTNVWWILTDFNK